MHSVVEKFLSFLNTKLDGFGKVLSLDQMFQLQAAQRQIVDADVADFVVAKRNSSTFIANKEGWQYNKVGADLAEFVSDAVEFMLCVGLAYCVRTAEIRVKALWRTLPLSWQTQPIYDVMYKFKERDDLNLRSNIEHAMKHCKVNPSVFLELVLKNDSGALDRKKLEAADRAIMEKQLADLEEKKFHEASEKMFEAVHALPNYEELFAECVAWYKARYPKSFINIDSMPMCVDSYLVNLTQRGGYENFDNRNDDNTNADQTQNLDAALLDNE